MTVMGNENLLIDPNSPAYEAARGEMVDVLRQIGREDSRNGYARMADDLTVGNLMYVPTWIALALMARAPAEQTGWQPIETAPKDGTQFLALVSNGWHALVSAPADGLRNGWSYLWWRSSDRQSYPIVQTHSAGTNWAATSTLLLTHWQPLPAPPGATRVPADLRSDGWTDAGKAWLAGGAPIIPEGMKPWHGGDEPADWDGGPVLRRHGGMSMPDGAYAWLSNGGGAGNVIAYTPKATSA